MYYRSEIHQTKTTEVQNKKSSEIVNGKKDVEFEKGMKTGRERTVS